MRFRLPDHDLDIILAMERRMKELDVKIHLMKRREKVLADETKVPWVFAGEWSVIGGCLALLPRRANLSYDRIDG